MLQCHGPSGRVAEGLCPSTLLPTLPAPLPAPLAAFQEVVRDDTVYRTLALGTAAFHLFVSPSSWGLHGRLYSEALV